MLVVAALEQLFALGALTEIGDLSPLGKQMASFPLDPTFSKILIQSKTFKCTSEAISVISMLSIDPVFFFPYEQREEAAVAKKKFVNYDGDHITLLNVLKAYENIQNNAIWCRDHFINQRSMKQIMVKIVA